MALGYSTLTHYSNALRAYVLPTFKDMDVRTITRKSIQDFLTLQAKNYSGSSLKSMRVVLCMTLKWAEQTGYTVQPNGWLEGIRLPREVHPKRTVERTELTPEQTLAIIAELDEPYATLVLCLASVGLRGEEAVGLQPIDLDANNVLHVRRVIFNGRIEELKKEKPLQLDSTIHADLIRRMRALGVGAKWIFHSRAGTPVNLGNSRRRYLHPAAAKAGTTVGGWHDFRHTIVRSMRRLDVNPVVVSGVVGHKKVELAPEVYDRASATDMGQALRLIGHQLLPTVLPTDTVN